QYVESSSYNSYNNNIKMNKIIKIIFFLAFTFSLAPETVLANNKIKIGLLIPLTGKNSEIGQSIIKSTRLAINTINNVSIEIVPKDTQSNPAITLRAAKELANSGIKIVIGPVFNESLIYLDELNELTFLALTNKNDNFSKNIINAGISSKGVFGTGVSVAFDPRSLGTQIDDSVMQKNLATRLALRNKSYILNVSTKVLDGKIFVTGKVDDPEEKLQITKLAWETKGARSVKNDIKIKEDFNFQQSAKDLLITSQLRTALIFNKKIKATNYQIDTYKKKIFIYGISLTTEERKEVINEAKEILDVEDVIASIVLVEDLRIQKN
ncbi:BON domain-containing protein, partial [Candidatus Pelagibacter sp.]|nr:BON domain-containing protein [Candidatus Pelagibacter sp.]